jgi:hypothetical protein
MASGQSHIETFDPKPLLDPTQRSGAARGIRRTCNGMRMTISRRTTCGAARTDQPIAALLKDLKRLGLLDSTLAFWGGGFGARWNHKGVKAAIIILAFPWWLAGGRIKGGPVVGATDAFGLQLKIPAIWKIYTAPSSIESA